MLDWRHQETIRHEPCRALEIEWWREVPRVGNEIILVEWVPPVELMDLNSQKVIFVWAAFLADRALADSGQCLGYCICDATQHL